MTKLFHTLLTTSLFLCFLLCQFSLTGEEEISETKSAGTKSETSQESIKSQEVKPPEIGNFSLPTSQQPAALFGFGGNIIDKGEVQFYFFADDFVGKHRCTTDLIPNIVVGITDNWSVAFEFPCTPYLKDGNNRSDGPEDFYIQLENAFYNHSTSTYLDQATLVANITAPTGSIKKNPPTGFGSPSLFIGATYYRMYVDWFYFAAPGAILISSENKKKVGDQFLYQVGFGRNIPSPEGWIYAWIIEVDGQYNKKNTPKVLNNFTGGNAIYVTPSLWVSSKELVVQFGVSIPVNQNLYGNQHKFDYALNLNMGWSFY